MKYYLYDIEDSSSFSDYLNLRVLSSLKGISQLNHVSGLFLCGNNSQEDQSTSGSILIKSSFNSYAPSINILISSINSHINPTLIGFRNDIILVIGGKRETFCECYYIKTNKWKTLARLPNERYHSIAMIDRIEENAYLFGGYDSLTNVYNNSILRLNLIKKSIWETIKIKEGLYLLERSSSAMFKGSNSNKIFIIGGKDKSGNSKDDVIEYDTFCNIINRSDIKLKEAAKFNNPIGININHQLFAFFDKRGNIHTVNLKNHNSDLKLAKDIIF